MSTLSTAAFTIKGDRTKLLHLYDAFLMALSEDRKVKDLLYYIGLSDEDIKDQGIFCGGTIDRVEMNSDFSGKDGTLFVYEEAEGGPYIQAVEKFVHTFFPEASFLFEGECLEEDILFSNDPKKTGNLFIDSYTTSKDISEELQDLGEKYNGKSSDIFVGNMRSFFHDDTLDIYDIEELIQEIYEEKGDNFLSIHRYEYADISECA